MEVAVLTARLEAQTSAFLASMKSVQHELNASDRSVKKLEKAVEELNRAMKKIHLDSSDAMKTEAAADRQVRSLHKIRDAAIEAAAAEGQVGNLNMSGSINGAYRGPGGRFVGQTDKQAEAAARMSAAARGGMGGGSFDASGRLRGPGGQFVSRGGGVPMGPASEVAGFSRQSRYMGSGYAMGGTVIRDSDEWLVARRKAAQDQRLYENEVRNLRMNRGRFSNTPVPMGAVMSDRLAGFGRKNFLNPDMRSYGLLGEVTRGYGYRGGGTSAEEYLARRGIRGSSESVGGGLFGGGGNGGGRRGGLLSDLYNGGGRYGGAGRYDVPGLNFLAGILPGGRRARPAAVLSGLGLGLATTPTLGPAAVGLGAAGSAGIVSLIGGIGTLKLAFAGLNAAAFNTRKGFDALTPAQQRFVMTLKSLDAGLGHQLRGIAQSTVIPGLTKGIRSGITTGSVGALTGGVQAFGGAISGGAQQFGKLFGSQQFSAQFGTMLKNDAVLLRDMFRWATNLADAFVHLSVAAGPFVNWLAKGTTHFTKWIDDTIKAKQASGDLAHYFDRARVSLQAIGKLAASLTAPFRALVSAIGFENSLGTITLFTKVFNDFAARIRQNRKVLHDFFGGALGAAEDTLRVVNGLVKALGPLLAMINRLVGGVKGWQHVIDGVAIAWVAKVSLMKLSMLGLAKSEEMATAKLGSLRVGLSKIAGKVFTAAVLLSLIPVNSKGQKLLDTEGMGWTGKLPLVGGGFQQIAEFINQELRPLIGKDPINTGTLSPGYIPSGAHGPVMPGGSGLPPGMVGAPIGSKGQNLFTGKNAFGTPKPFTATSNGTVLPIGLQTAIDQAGFSGSVPAQIRAVKAGIAWISSHAGGVKDLSQRDLYYQEGSSLRSQLQSLTYKQMGGKPSALTTVFGLRRQAALAGAESRFSQGTASGAGPHQLQAAASKMIDFAQKQARFLKDEIASADKLGWTEKQRLAAAKELAKIQHDITRAMNAQHRASKMIAAEEKKAAKTVIQRAIDGFLGIGHGDGSSNAQAFRNRERKALLTMVRHLAPHSRGHGVIGDPLQAIPGAANMSVPQLIKALQAHHVHFSKAGLKALEGMQKAYDLAKKEGFKITAEQTAKQIALLTQISQHTDPRNRHANSYHLPSIKELMHGLKGSKSIRRALADRLAAVEILGGKIPSGQSAFGYAQNAGSQAGSGMMLPLLSGHFGGGGKVWGHGSPALKNALQAQFARQAGRGDIDPGMSVVIHINGHNKDPKALAKEVHHELSKAARRNPTQTRGPNAGRNRNLN